MLGGVHQQTPERRNANATGEEDRRSRRVVVQRERAVGALEADCGPERQRFEHTLNAVSRIRVATMIWSSCGALAMENVRV